MPETCWRTQFEIQKPNLLVCSKKLDDVEKVGSERLISDGFHSPERTERINRIKTENEVREGA